MGEFLKTTIFSISSPTFLLGSRPKIPGNFAHLPSLQPRRLLHGPRGAQLREPLVVRPLEAVPGVDQDVERAQGGPGLLGVNMVMIKQR